GSAECLLDTGARAVETGDAPRVEATRQGFQGGLAEAEEQGNEGWAAWLQAGSDALDAYAAWQNGDLGGADRAMRAIQLRPEAMFGLSGRLRLWLGTLAAQEGRFEDASQYFASLANTELGWYGVLQEARALRDSGDDQAASDAYRRFLDLWSEAPVDHVFVVEARQATGG
ncbi:MAG: hypothetical protein P8170_01685, partial [Gemmatimonadota bacterium]